MDKINQQDGFSLLEVLIAITLFGVFIVAFYSSQGYNLSDSELMEEDLKLASLATNIINEKLLDPPDFGQESKDTKSFEENELSDYQYTVELKKIELPDFSKLIDAQNSASEDGEDYGGTEESESSALQKMVLEKVKDNIEKILWQLRVTVVNKRTKYSYSLSTWLKDPKQKIKLDLNF